MVAKGLVMAVMERWAGAVTEVGVVIEVGIVTERWVW